MLFMKDLPSTVSMYGIYIAPIEDNYLEVFGNNPIYKGSE